MFVVAFSVAPPRCSPSVHNEFDPGTFSIEGKLIQQLLHSLCGTCWWLFPLLQKSVSFPDIVRMRFSLYTVRLVNNLAKNRPSLLTPVLEAHLFPLLVQSAIIPTRQDSASVTLDMEEMVGPFAVGRVAIYMCLVLSACPRSCVLVVILREPAYMNGQWMWHSERSLVSMSSSETVCALCSVRSGFFS